MHAGRTHLLKKLLCKNDKAFWKEIKLMNNSKLSLPNSIDGVTGSNNILTCGNPTMTSTCMRIY